VVSASKGTRIRPSSWTFLVGEKRDSLRLDRDAQRAVTLSGASFEVDAQ
jgi:hypothetical protein